MSGREGAESCRAAADPMTPREERYRALFDLIDEGFCVVEMIFDADGRPVDYLFLETNAIFEEQTGLVDAEGKTARQLVPDLEDDWFEIYGRVATTGEPSRFVNESAAMGRWFDVYACRLGEPDGRQVALLFTDITAKRRTEEAERRATERDRFRAELADQLRSLTDPLEIQAAAASTLGRALRTNRAFYAEAEPDGDHVVIHRDYHDGVPSAAGRYRLDDFGTTVAEALRVGRTLVVDDIDADASLSLEERAAFNAIAVRAHVTVCLIKDGRLTAVLGVHQNDARAWSEDEVALAEEVAERTWAAVARATAEHQLRVSEERLRLATEAVDMFSWEVDLGDEPDQSSHYANGVQLPIPAGLGDAISSTHPDDVQRVQETIRRAIERGGDFRVEYRLADSQGGQETWMLSAGVALKKSGSPARLVGVTQNITERKSSEEALREREAAARQARTHAELLTDVIGELEALDGVTARAHKLVQLLVPRLARSAAVELPDGAAVVEPPDADPRRGWHVQLPLPLGPDARATLVIGGDDDGPTAAIVEERALLGEIAERAALLIGNARLQEQEHRIALRLQHALLPGALVEHPQVELAACYYAASDALVVGGDWYDSLALPDGRIGLAVGDVVGHGLDAAAAMGRMRTALAALAGQSDSPGAVLTQLDRFTSGPNGAEFATACFAVLDPSTGVLRYALAGHPPILMVTPAGTTTWLDEARSVPLGGTAGGDRADACAVVEPGALLVLYSDGLVERRGEVIDSGLDRLARAVRSIADLPVDEVCDKLVAEMLGDQTGNDDVVVMCVRRSR